MYLSLRTSVDYDRLLHSLRLLELNQMSFLAFDKLLDTGNLINNLCCINETLTLIYQGGFPWATGKFELLWMSDLSSDWQ